MHTRRRSCWSPHCFDCSSAPHPPTATPRTVPRSPTAAAPWRRATSTSRSSGSTQSTSPGARRVHRAVAVRSLSPEARDLADRYFLDVLIRVHRVGEGAGFDGIKPAGADVPPQVVAADQALESGSIDPLRGLVADERWAELERRFGRAVARKDFDVDDLVAAREYMEAYVSFFKYAEGHDHDHATTTTGPRALMWWLTRVRSHSMAPTLTDGQLVLDLRPPHRTDLVVLLSAPPGRRGRSGCSAGRYGRPGAVGRRCLARRCSGGYPAALRGPTATADRFTLTRLGDPVDGEGADLVAAFVVRRDPAAAHLDRAHHALGCRCRGCRRSRPAPARRDSAASRSTAITSAGGWRRCPGTGRFAAARSPARIAATTAARAAAAGRRRVPAGAVPTRGPRPEHLGAGHPDGAVGGLDHRRRAELAEAGQQHVRAGRRR